MPCTDGADYEPQVNKRVFDEQVEENQQLKKRLDLAARAACDALSYIESCKDLENMTKGTQVWWRRHKQDDARKAQERKAWQKKRKEAMKEVANLMAKGQYDKAKAIINGLVNDDES